MSTLRRVAQWVQAVDSSDPVRRALNAGLAWVLLAMAALALAMGAVLLWVDRPALTVLAAFVTSS